MTTDAQAALAQVRDALAAMRGDWLGDGFTKLRRSQIVAVLDEQAAEIERLRAVVSALAFYANRDPFTTIGHWCEHGPCAAIIRDVSNPYADHHGPDWTQRDSEYLK